jgi:hypothetical protein
MAERSACAEHGILKSQYMLFLSKQIKQKKHATRKFFFALCYFLWLVCPFKHIPSLPPLSKMQYCKSNIS